MPYRLVYHARIPRDLAKIAPRDRSRIADAIAARLTSAPERYGVPLRGTLGGYRKLRVGDIRVVFELRGEDVVILAIGHRREVYAQASRRA